MNAPDPMKKQIILAKLISLIDQVPEPPTLSRQWISEAKALIKQHDPLLVGIHLHTKAEFYFFDFGIGPDPETKAKEIMGYVTDTVETIKVELELDGRTEIGTAYSAGEVYKYFTDLKQIIWKAEREVLVVDPYLDGKTFDSYFRDCPKDTVIRILTCKYADRVKPYITKHEKEYGTNITMKKSDELHDRLIVIDCAECWFSGGSIKDAATSKPTYLIPITGSILNDKIKMYNEIWDRAETP